MQEWGLNRYGCLRKILIAAITLGACGIVLVGLGVLDISDLFASHHGKWTLRWQSSHCLRLYQGTSENATLISPTNDLKWWGIILSGFAREREGLYTRLSATPGIWMFDTRAVLDDHAEGFVVYLVNPKLSHSVDRVFVMLDRVNPKGSDWDAITQAAAESFVYLGWVVRDEADVQALKDALVDRSKVDLDQDLQTPHGILRRLRVGVEKEFATDPNDPASLAAASQQIPIMFEAMNAKAGHPMDAMHVLYLDGHIDRIPFGERFPATQAFVDAFPAPVLPLP